MASRTVSRRAVRSSWGPGSPTPFIERPSRAMADTTSNTRWSGVVGQRLVGGEGAGGAQEGVDERGLAVIDMSDERDVAQRGGVHISPIGRSDAASPGAGRLPVVLVLVVVERDAVLLSEGGVLVVFGRRMGI